MADDITGDGHMTLAGNRQVSLGQMDLLNQGNIQVIFGDMQQFGQLTLEFGGTAVRVGQKEPKLI